MDKHKQEPTPSSTPPPARTEDRRASEARTSPTIDLSGKPLAGPGRNPLQDPASVEKRAKRLDNLFPTHTHPVGQEGQGDERIWQAARAFAEAVSEVQSGDADSDLLDRIREIANEAIGNTK